MTQATSKRRGHGEDSIYRDASRNRYIGISAVDLGVNGTGTRTRKKVSGKTKAEVRDTLRELHKELGTGLRPRRRYTVNDALEDWLEHFAGAEAPTAGTRGRRFYSTLAPPEPPADQCLRGSGRVSGLPPSAMGASGI